MKKSSAEPTTAENLEQRFDRGEEVLDYFDVRSARVIKPQSKGPAAKGKSSLMKRPSNRKAVVVREKPTRYGTKK